MIKKHVEIEVCRPKRSDTCIEIIHSNLRIVKL